MELWCSGGVVASDSGKNVTLLISSAKLVQPDCCVVLEARLFGLFGHSLQFGACGVADSGVVCGEEDA